MELILNEIKRNFKGTKDFKESCRLFHGRGQSFEGYNDLNIDWVSPYVFIECFKDYSKEELASLVEILNSQIGDQSKGIFYRNRKSSFEYETLQGELPTELHLIENNLSYLIDLSTKQNFGFFLDMKKGREKLSELCEGKSVLNLFSYTCAFSVVAKAANASEIMNIDMKKSFLRTGQQNHALNNLPMRGVKFISYDIMKSLNGIEKKGPWDIIVIDPPSAQGKSFQVGKDYPKIFERLKKWLAPGGIIMACLNSPFHDFNFLKELGKDFEFIEFLDPVSEFKEKDQAQGLKIALFK